MSVTAQVTRIVDAPAQTVWEVLDDFPGISTWSAGIQRSYTTGNPAIATGLGAERRCELGGRKVLDERISSYEEGSSMTVDVWNTEGLPVKSSRATFSVRSLDDGTTEARIDATAVPSLPGLLVKMAEPVLSKGLAKNFAGLLDELAAASEQTASSDR